MNEIEHLPIPHTDNLRTRRAYTRIHRSAPETADHKSAYARLMTNIKRHIIRFEKWCANQPPTPE